MGIKVLFIYPNTFGMNMLPPAVALFSALLKKEGHKFDLFNAWYLVKRVIDQPGEILSYVKRILKSGSVWR